MIASEGQTFSTTLTDVIITKDDDDGTLSASWLLRTRRETTQCNMRPFAENERARWLEAAHDAARLADAGRRCVTVVADRGCNICNGSALRPANTDLLFRCHDGPARCDCNARNATARRDDLTYVEAHDIGDSPRIKLTTPGHDAGRAGQIVGLYRWCWLFRDLTLS